MKTHTSRQSQLKPLCIDLDKTLVNQDVFRRTMAVWISRRCKPWIGWPSLNRNDFKEWLYRNVNLGSIEWTLNSEVVSLMNKSRQEGRNVVLITGNSKAAAEFFASQLAAVTLILPSSKEVAFKGIRKLRKLEELFGIYNFDYIGDSINDLPIWRASNQAYILRKNGYALRIMLFALNGVRNKPILLIPDK